MHRICVFCGSSVGASSAYVEAVGQMSAALTDRSLGLVYGGGDVGLMGELANAVLASGGEVIGVIPKALAKKEVAHWNLSKLHIVESMHERKALMYDLSDGFVALPGGIGTLEEFFEILTWAQLGMHAKPCGLLNVEDYWSKMLDFLDHAVAERFYKEKHRSMVLVDESAAGLLRQFDEYEPVAVTKWIDREGA